MKFNSANMLLLPPVVVACHNTPFAMPVAAINTAPLPVCAPAPRQKTTGGIAISRLNEEN
jgi:hypothetical protein